MSNYIELIAQLKPKNNANFPIADSIDLIGGYIQIPTYADLHNYPTQKIREGMLAYVIEDSLQHLYIRKGNDWFPFMGADSSGVTVVTSTQDLTPLQNIGKLIYISDTQILSYYNGSSWESVPKIYIQSTEPTDKSGIWIDDSDQHSYTEIQ